MKIISKYKDFYDYLWIDGDPDIIYVRKEKPCFNVLDDSIFRCNYEKHLGTGMKSYAWVSNAGHITLCGFTFGIFPYVYTVPAISISLDSLSYYFKILSNADVKAIFELKEMNKQKEYVTNILNEFFKGNENAPHQYSWSYFWRNSMTTELNRYIWKDENQDLFFNLGAPVFCVYVNELFYGTAYEEAASIKPTKENKDKIAFIKGARMRGDNAVTLMTNVCFNKLNFPITKFWFDELNSVNTYSNIESFLLTSKLDPEPKITNEGKIIAHGFDLKTSFRKM